MSNPYTPPESAELRDAAAFVRPRPVVAVLLSLCATGAGYYYSGARWRLVALAALIPGLLVCIALTVRAGMPPWTFAVYMLLSACIWIDTYRQARRPDARRPPWPELAGVVVFCLVYFGGISALFRRYVMEPFYVPSAAMAPALEIGDYFTADKISYLGGEPQRGDIAVFRFPDDPSVNYVKRIIGVPGDRVTLTPEGEVEINGTRLPLASAGTYGEGSSQLTLQREETAPERSHLILRMAPLRGMPQTFSVPADSYFVLGDNRDNSKDSRRWQHSYVPRHDVLGRAVYRHFSLDPETGWPRFGRVGRIEESVALPAETRAPAGP